MGEAAARGQSVEPSDAEVVEALVGHTLMGIRRRAFEQQVERAFGPHALAPAMRLKFQTG